MKTLLIGLLVIGMVSAGGVAFAASNIDLSDLAPGFASADSPANGSFAGDDGNTCPHDRGDHSDCNRSGGNRSGCNHSNCNGTSGNHSGCNHSGRNHSGCGHCC